EGSPYPVLINAFGSDARMQLALSDQSPDAVAGALEGYLRLLSQFSISALLRSIPRLLRLLHAFPLRKFHRGHCQQVIHRDPDLGTLPVLHCWPQDGGRFFTLPLVFTREPGKRRQNVGMYRMQVLDRQTTAMHWHKHKDGSALFDAYKAGGRRMPVSVALGCDPAITYAATAPLPKGLDEMMFAGFLRRANVRMVKSITNELLVPDSAEFVLEGYVDPDEALVLEGPFGDHTGYYSLADYYPRFHVTCITHRKQPVYPATVVGKPPMEDCYLAKATERIFLPVLKLQIPELVDINLPLEGVFHNCAILSVQTRYPGAARKVMNAVWGMGQMMYTKMIVVVDAHVDVQNLAAVGDAVLKNLRGRQSLVLCEGPLDALDHSSNTALYGTRLGIDATQASAPREAGVREAYSVISVHKTKAFAGRKALEQALRGSDSELVICVDDTVDTADLSTVLWKVFNNIDAGRDLVFAGQKIGIDATKKWREESLHRDWPDDIIMSDAMKRQVSSRWEEYGFDRTGA
nr:menaquinone biosynthesis decarboxylase [Candidatus Limiplasma sp.]